MLTVQQLIDRDEELEQRRDLVLLRNEVERLKLVLDISEYSESLRQKMRSIKGQSNLARLGSLLEKWEKVQSRIEEGSSGRIMASYPRITSVNPQSLKPTPPVMDEWMGEIRVRLANLISSEKSRIHS